MNLGSKICKCCHKEYYDDFTFYCVYCYLEIINKSHKYRYYGVEYSEEYIAINIQHFP